MSEIIIAIILLCIVLLVVFLILFIFKKNKDKYSHLPPPATSCKGWTCNTENQLCPQGVPGASKNDYRCCNKRWIEGDDLCKGPPTKPPPPPPIDPPGAITLRTVNYNVFGRWYGVTGYEGQDTRLENIPDAIAAHPKMGRGVDVITIEEAWCPDSQLFSGPILCLGDESRNLLINSMYKKGWKYHTKVIDDPGVSVFKKQTSGGAMIFSRWPIESSTGYVYKTTAGEDEHAAKGAVYIRITKTNSKGLKQVFNIINTHLQAWSTPEGKRVRKGQLTEIMRDFLPKLGIATDGTEPIIFQGDMNADYVLYPEEVDDMLRILNAKMPKFVPNSPLFSSNPSTNFLVGKDGAAVKDDCLSTYKAQLGGGKGVIRRKPTAACEDIPTTTASGKPLRPRFSKNGKLNVGKDCTAYCPCCPHEMLDYILYSNSSKYLQPISSNIEIIPLQSIKPLTYEWGWCDGAGCIFKGDKSGKITSSELSDHYPMVANFVFRPKTKKFKSPDGCKKNSDCHYRPFSFLSSCYCEGPGCTWNGKKASGWDLGGRHPINDNCHFRLSSSESCFCRPGNQ